MTEQHCDQLFDYYNGHLSDIEHARFEKHLEECSECKQALLQIRELEDYLPYASEPISLPSGMEDRVFSRILKEDNQKETSFQSAARKRNKWMLPSVAALLAVSLIGNAYFFTQLGEQQETAEVEESIDKVVKYAEMAAVEGNAKGTASIVKQGDETKLVVQASDLRGLSDEEVYQVWLIKDEKPERAGTFTIENGRGSVVFSFNENYENIEWDMVAVSHEPDADSQTPKGNVVLASEL
ncbi:anti-sigma factor [Rossellomorea vietnamensis]|uniref:Anti-sigma-W factor RsiW n=1 Tax=Rossellomorea vietnamensis TaxID=218284 RepID=A0A5D4KEN3_9BACI|nr:anti-sigma factor [Rossellomorea vietnamensis]TYR74683.1 anti-sigma factor [Rossellomorea vietnamensis]